ncbi:TonB-dependent receptor [uncultured Pseudoteredinibacter sp.]|uniref:TonB-dependent receptor n=1 Tax=uncultured Pseudoteredinibacter sp. TaxID=1641701 RepID=UPI0026351867|nr:TonB-dependent receptor [uncultured Pseudoteredinibacter sp.]
MTFKKNALSSTIALLSTAVISYSSQASVLEEVTVTAQKREQSLQDVGIAVTAFSGDQMSALGVTQSHDIATFSPGVHISGNMAGQNTQFTIRGVTQNDFNDIVEAPNAVYLDEGYLAIAQAQTFAVFDVDRVEILKGPQGTLFGRNATGGLVHYISRKANMEEVEGYIDLTFGQYDTPANANKWTLEGAVGGPLTEKLGARVAFKTNQQDGYLKNLYPQGANSDLPGGGSPGNGAGADLGGDDTKAARLNLTYEASDDTTINFSANYASSKSSTGPYQSKSTIAVLDANGELINVIDTPAGETRLTIQGDGDGGADVIDGDQFIPGGAIGLAGRPVPGGDFFGYVDQDGADFTFSGDFAFEDQGSTDTWGLNFNIAKEINENVTMTAITDYKDYEKLLFIDVDAAPINQLANYAGVDASSFSQEIRFNGESESSRWVAGLFYLNIDNHSDNGLKAPVNSIVDALFPPVDIGVQANLETNSYSVFGQVEYDIGDQLMLTAGLRVMEEKKDYDVEIGVYLSEGNHTVNQGSPIPNAFGAGSPFNHDLESSDTLWTGKVQLDYRPTDDLLIYAGINRGVKAGSFNAPLLGAYLGSGGEAALPYDEEILMAYEAGFKATLGDGNTRLNGSAYYYDYSDYQAFLFVGVGGVVINADAVNKGIELELITSPAEGWDILLSASYLDATVEDVLLRSGSPLPPRDVRPTYAPEVQATALVRYEWEAMGGMMHVAADVSYSDEFYYNLRNFDADKFDSYVMTNARLGWASADDKWEASLILRNVTDERAGVQGFDLATLCGCNEVSYRDPRWTGVNVKYRF